MRPTQKTMFLMGAALAILFVAAATFTVGANNNADVPEVVYTGTITTPSGDPIGGATVSLFSNDKTRSVSVYSKADGTFELPPMPSEAYKMRARLMGLHDEWVDIKPGEPKPVTFSLKKAEGWALQLQRPGHSLMNMLEWENEADALNFKMMCAYCHQVGTLGFRSPEEPVDWEVMLTRMDGFQGLYKHTQDVLVDKIYNTYGREAEAKWPAFEAPPAPKGSDLDAIVTEWQMGQENVAMIHDIAVASDGMIYTVDMTNDAIESLDPKTGERNVYEFPGGRAYEDITSPPIKGPHSVEEGPNGNMWVTLALSGQMAEFDVKTKEFKIGSGHVAPRPRAGYPHTLRFAPDGHLWWTDAALGVFSLDPKTWDGERWEVKAYKLPSKDQVRGQGARGESRGVTPYGIDVAPNGNIFYTKLNGQRVGRIIPSKADDDPEKIVEWAPPVHGPRRLHVAPDGLVWVPGWASGNIASFDENTEEWAVYDLPHGPNSLPYALNINPVTGDIWICGTGTDSMLRFDPKTKQFSEYRMPSRVTYTREIEFDKEGNAWTTNSNYPPRHIEDGHGSVIKIAVR